MSDERLVIVDTNVFFSGLSVRPGNPAAVLRMVKWPQMSVSLDLLAEYRRVLYSERAIRYLELATHEWDAVIEAIERQAVLEAPMSGPNCPDPMDQHLWDLLATVEASDLVTGERKLLASHHFPGRIFRRDSSWRCRCEVP
ncbi:MAG: PIN domain-containing protein [bacterium]